MIITSRRPAHVGTTVRISAVLRAFGDDDTPAVADGLVTFTIDDGNDPAPAPLTAALQPDGSYAADWVVTPGSETVRVLVSAVVDGLPEVESLEFGRRTR